MTAIPDTIEELTRHAAQVTPAQYGYLCQGIDPSRVRQMQGQSHVEAWDIRRTLIRIFGFGGFNIEDRGVHLITQLEFPPDTPKGKTRYTVVYRADVRLTIKDALGREIAHFDDSATGDACNMPSIGDAHDFALKTASSQALKRCAVNMGDQFGLSLYNKGNTGAVVVRSLVSPVEQAGPTPQDAPAVLGGEMDDRGQREETQEAPAAAPAARPRQNARPGSGIPSQAMAIAVEVSEMTDADAIVAKYRAADAAKLLAVDVAKALHPDLLDVVGIEPGGPVLLGAWMASAGKYVRGAGGLSVANTAQLAAGGAA